MAENNNIRYARQIMLDEIGADGQQKLLDSSVFILGAGGLGSPVAMYLAAAGVGRIGIADADCIELSNLQRQIIHRSAKIGAKKVVSAKETLLGINPQTEVEIYPIRITKENIAQIISGYDFVLDCADNYETKFLINDACVNERKPFCHAGINGFKGQLFTYIPNKSACLRCIFDEPDDDNSPVGVVGAVAGVIGSLEAMEAIKYITQTGTQLCSNILMVNTLTMEIRKIPFAKRDGCICGK